MADETLSPEGMDRVMGNVAAMHDGGHMQYASDSPAPAPTPIEAAAAAPAAGAGGALGVGTDVHPIGMVGE